MMRLTQRVSSIIWSQGLSKRFSEDDLVANRWRGAHRTGLLDNDVCNCAPISDVVGVNAVRRSSGRRRAGPKCLGHIYSHARWVITHPSTHSTHPITKKLHPNKNMCSVDVDSKTVYILVTKCDVKWAVRVLFVCLLGLDSLALVRPLSCQKDSSFCQRKVEPRDPCHGTKMSGSSATWIKCKLVIVGGQRRRLSSWRRLLSYTYVCTQQSFRFSSMILRVVVTYLIWEPLIILATGNYSHVALTSPTTGDLFFFSASSAPHLTNLYLTLRQLNHSNKHQSTYCGLLRAKVFECTSLNSSYVCE